MRRRDGNKKSDSKIGTRGKSPRDERGSTGVQAPQQKSRMGGPWESTIAETTQRRIARTKGVQDKRLPSDNDEKRRGGADRRPLKKKINRQNQNEKTNLWNLAVKRERKN